MRGSIRLCAGYAERFFHAVNRIYTQRYSIQYLSIKPDERVITIALGAIHLSLFFD